MREERYHIRRIRQMFDSSLFMLWSRVCIKKLHYKKSEMSALLEINENPHFVTIEFKDESSISLCLTNFSEAFKCEITKEEAVRKAKVNKSFVEF